MAKKKRVFETNLADILFPTLTEEELNESILNIPPEQRRFPTGADMQPGKCALAYLCQQHALKI